MIAIVLLVAAIAVALAGLPLRSRAAHDRARTDEQVRRIDLVMTVVLAALFGAAAIAAAVASPMTGAGRAAVEVIAVVAAAVTGGPVVRVVLAAGGIPTRSENYDDPEAEPMLRGGRIIGVLERTGVAASLILAWPAGIAVILGIKGLARFPQLREHHASEQFILGTFASVLWACAAAGIGFLIGR
ncbi:hypothetical protein [Gordonia caeni]|uniref:Uncharacterized protein n=1 Tax=Gordonia caeni TaxID=1007097 RepID=A0ABP7PS99_9ACTN